MNKFLWIFFFLPFVVFSQAIHKDSVRVNLSNPNATIYTHLHFLQPDSYHPNKAAKTILGLSEKKAAEKVVKIKQVLDGKGLFIDFNKIPNNPNYKDTLGYSSYYRYVLFPQRMPQIYVEKIEGKWYYSSETVANIDNLYKEVFPWYVQKLQKIIPDSGHKKILGIEVWQTLALLILVVLSILIFYIFKKIAYKILQKIQHYITKSNANIEIDKVLKKLAHPISLLIALKFIDIVFPSLQFSLTVNKWVFLAINIAETVFWIYVFLKLVKVVMQIYKEITEKTHNKLDDQLVPILNNLLTGIVLIFGFFNHTGIIPKTNVILLATAE